MLRQRYLDEVDLLRYPSLTRIEQFIRDRDNLYDNPASEHPGSDYEEIDFNSANLSDNLSQGSSQESGNNSTRDNTPEPPVNQNELNRVEMARENLPLISAGTYHGLLTENPNDFIDKYEIAAKSNNWQELSKINLFPAHLAGTALAWYKHYSAGQNINNWENLKTTFITTFTPAAQAQTIQAVLEKRFKVGTNLFSHII